MRLEVNGQLQEAGWAKGQAGSYSEWTKPVFGRCARVCGHRPSSVPRSVQVQFVMDEVQVQFVMDEMFLLSTSVSLANSHATKYYIVLSAFDCLCALVVRVPGYRSRGPGFDSRRYQIV
jgi:hypothetical protein